MLATDRLIPYGVRGALQSQFDMLIHLRRYALNVDVINETRQINCSSFQRAVAG